VPHAIYSNAQTLVLALDVVQKHFFMLQLVLEGRQEGLVLIFSLTFIGIRVQSILEFTACERLRLIFLWTRLIAFLFVLFTDFLINLILDLLQLLLGLLVSVRQNEKALTLMLKLARVVIGLGLQAHWLCLVQAVPSLYEFVV
jgi:hypothetical protein